MLGFGLLFMRWANLVAPSLGHGDGLNLSEYSTADPWIFFTWKDSPLQGYDMGSFRSESIMDNTQVTSHGNAEQLDGGVKLFVS